MGWWPQAGKPNPCLKSDIKQRNGERAGGGGGGGGSSVVYNHHLLYPNFTDFPLKDDRGFI